MAEKKKKAEHTRRKKSCMQRMNKNQLCRHESEKERERPNWHENTNVQKNKIWKTVSQI